MSLIFSTQLAAVATTALAAFAIITAVFAILAYLKQSREVTAVEQPVKEQARQLELQQKQFDQQRRAQESRVFIWVEG